MHLLASELDGGGFNLCHLEASKNYLDDDAVCFCVVFLLAVSGLSQILQGHPQLLTKFPAPS